MMHGFKTWLEIHTINEPLCFILIIHLYVYMYVYSVTIGSTQGPRRSSEVLALWYRAGDRHFTKPCRSTINTGRAEIC